MVALPDARAAFSAISRSPTASPCRMRLSERNIVRISWAIASRSSGATRTPCTSVQCWACTGRGFGVIDAEPDVPEQNRPLANNMAHPPTSFAHRPLVMFVASCRARHHLLRAFGESRVMVFTRLLPLLVAFVLVVPLDPPLVGADVANPICPVEVVHFNPANGEDIVVPPGFKVSVFKAGLNAPTGIAFRGNARSFEVFVLESGHGLPSRCNEQDSWPGGTFAKTNPFTPDILVFDQDGKLLRGPLGKPTQAGGGFQAAGPAIDIAFERGLKGGRLFATDSNQAIRTPGAQNNSSRIVLVNPETGDVTPFIVGLPTGDHPAEQLAIKGDWIYWSQGSTTNSGVVGRDNGGGLNQPDIP